MNKIKFEVTEENIIYDDGIILIANKPCGIPSQGTDDPRKDHFFAALKRYMNGKYLVLHHRLDAPTSGIMLLGRHQKYNKRMTDLFREREIEKSYLALVKPSGAIEKEWTYTSNLLKVRKGRFLVSKSDPSGDEAITSFKFLGQKGKFALLECRPKTGRMHQIRVQLVEQEMPILGDFVYAKRLRAERLMLHAWKIKFKHPQSGKLVEFEAPVPSLFETII